MSALLGPSILHPLFVTMRCPNLVASWIDRSRFLRRHGVALVIVLVVIVFLALAAYTFTDLMITHRQASKWSGRQTQARLLAESGVAALQQFLALDEQGRMAEGGVHDNRHRFRGVV